jgi:hypothetical protein
MFPSSNASNADLSFAGIGTGAGRSLVGPVVLETHSKTFKKVEDLPDAPIKFLSFLRREIPLI